MSDAILQAIQQLDAKVDALQTQGATIVERVGNLKETVEKHLESDADVHKSQGARITSLEHTRTSWKARMASVAAAVAFAVSLILIGAKEAFAMIFKAPGS